MLRKKVHFPIFIIVLLLCCISCTKSIEDRNFKRKAYDSITDLAEASFKKQEYEKAYRYYFISKTLTNADEAERKIYTLGKLAEIYRINGDYLESEATATEAFQFFEDCKAPAYKAFIYNCLGMNFQEKEDFKNAIKYYIKAYQLTSSAIDKIIIENNMAVVYLEQEDYKKVISKLQPLLTNDTLHKYPVYYAKVLDNLGVAHFKLNLPQAYNYLKEALVIRDSLKSDFESFSSYLHFSKYYQQNNPALSLEFATKAYDASTNNPEDRLEALDLLIKNSDGTALKNYYDTYSSLNRKIKKAKESNSNEFAKTKYDLGKVMEEKEEAEYRANNITIVLISVTLLLLTILFLVRYINRQRLKISVYNTETRISKKIHDELANDIFNSLTFAQSFDLKDNEKKESFMQGMDKIYNNARNISNENNEIETGEGFEAFLKEMITSYNNEQVTVIIKDNKEIAWNAINKHKKVAIYRVLQELLVNMKKYSKCRFAVISFDKNNDAIEISYSDNGIGVAGGPIKKNGLQNAENRIKTIKGTITFETEANKGFKAYIRI
jgi:signal transduction histidine kinase